MRSKENTWGVLLKVSVLSQQYKWWKIRESFVGTLALVNKANFARKMQTSRNQGS